jgi:F-type H+-transporting ATPase subunit a
MMIRSAKRLLVAVFSLFCLSFSNVLLAQPQGGQADTHINNEGEHKMDQETKPKFDANEVIFGHVLDAHQFHFYSYKGADGQDHHATISLPVILYSPQKGLSTFSSGRFHHGEEEYLGYRLVTEHYREELKEKGYSEEALKTLRNESIIAVNEEGLPEPGVKVYDFSLTRNVVQMIIALTLLVWILTSAAKRYKTGQGINSAPKGMQNAIEPVVTFIRDEVAKPNIGHQYKKYMPFLLTVFFFILINNIFGLIPGSANVTGNIAFTAVLGVISFIIITLSGNKHYWGHIFNPPVPFGIKFIMVPVEILSIFTKPFALIIRLFANMLAGHILIICLISLIFIFGSLGKAIGWGFAPVSIAFSVFIFMIEVLVAFIQAFIFTNLTAVFIGQATEDHHQHEADAHHGNPPTEPVII